MKLEKQKIVLDFDDTLVKSSEQIIHMLNQKHNLNKTIVDLTEWNYASIYPQITNQEITELYSSQQFFKEVKWNEGVKSFLLKFKNNYKFVICSKGSKENLRLKEKSDYIKVASIQRGVDGGIRTLAPVTQPTSLAGKPLEPLEYVDIYQGCYIIIAN